MRKLVFIFAAICIVAGCAKVETFGPELSFDVYANRVDPGTRADDATYVPTGTGHLPDGSQFGVFAYFHPATSGGAGSWNDSNRNHPNLMYNQPVTVHEDAGVYTYSYSPKRYWPGNTNETISFFAYYPYDPKGTSSSTDPGIRSTLNSSSHGMGTLRFTSSEKANEQVDFLISDLCMDQSKLGGVLTGSGTDEGKVRFTFHHMLSMVRVRVASISSENPNIHIDESSYKFKFYGFPIAGNCVPTPGTKQANGYTPCTYPWNSLLTTVTYRQGEELIERETEMSVPKYTGAADYSDFLLIIPHTVQPTERLQVTFDLDRDSYHDEGYSFEDNPLFAYIQPRIERFEANKIYTFNITVSLNAINFTATVEDWNTGSGDLVFDK